MFAIEFMFIFYEFYAYFHKILTKIDIDTIYNRNILEI